MKLKNLSLNQQKARSRLVQVVQFYHKVVSTGRQFFVVVGTAPIVLIGLGVEYRVAPLVENRDIQFCCSLTYRTLMRDFEFVIKTVIIGGYDGWDKTIWCAAD